MLKKVLSVALLLAVLQFGLSQDARAQSSKFSPKSSTGTYYTNAAGVRLEFGSGYGALFGFSGKHFFTEHHAGEGQLLFGTGVTILEIAYQYHAPIASTEGLQWYAGLGTALAFSKGNFESKGSTDFWLRPMGGLDYKIANGPVNLSLDWRPVLSFSGGTHMEAGRFGIAARYTF
jgi:hypothetical protein